MPQVRKRPCTPQEIEAAAEPFRDIAIRLDAIAAVVRSQKLKHIELKLGTLTGAMFQRIQDSMDVVEADAKKSIRKQKAS